MIPFKVSWTRGLFDGESNPDSWWEWFTAATMIETTETDRFCRAKIEMMVSKSVGETGNGVKERSVAKDTKEFQSDE